jgi:hypothetical protein
MCFNFVTFVVISSLCDHPNVRHGVLGVYFQYNLYFPDKGNILKHLLWDN